MLSIMEERLEEGDVIQMGRLGNFRMVADSKCIANEKDFNVSFLNKAHIVFSPSNMLKRFAAMPNTKRWISKTQLLPKVVVVVARIVRKLNNVLI